MKRQFNVHGKVTKIVALLLITGTLNSSAQMNTDGNGGNQPLIQTVANSEGDNIVQVKWDNPTGERFAVVVRNKAGEILFNEVYSEQKFDKKFRLPLKEDDGLILTLRTLKGKTISSVQINNNIRTVEELVIRKID
jgi:DNA/RNA endonuclease YhcR with UshA esterase domain